MITFVFSDGAGVSVEFKTDMLPVSNDNQVGGPFTVLEVVGLSEAEIALGFNFRQLPYNYQAFKEFAEDKGLELIFIDMGSDTRTTVVELPEES